MAIKNNGLSNKSAERFLIDAGAIYMNLTQDEVTFEFSGTLLGATSGGNTFEVDTEIRQIEVDGLKGNKGKGLQIIEMQNPQMTVNMKEMTAQNLAKVIAGGEVDTTTDTVYDIITSKGTIEMEDYMSNIGLVGKLTGSDIPVVIVMDNVLSFEGLEMAFTESGEVVVPVNFAGHYDLDTMEVPYKIYFPKLPA